MGEEDEGPRTRDRGQAHAVERGSGGVREVQSYQEQGGRPDSGAVIRPPVCARRHASKLGSPRPQRLGDRGPVLPDDCISKDWPSGP